MSATIEFARWIAVDWGNTHQRAWAIGADGGVRAHVARERDPRDIPPDAWEAALLDLIGDWLGMGRIPVLACGMIGGRGGLCEVDYRPVPAKPADMRPSAVPGLRDGRIALSIMPGLCQSGPADVMRGEETQLAGFLTATPAFDGVVCLPGTHSKWVQISAAEVVSFQTAMTGELFSLLSQHSSLAQYVASDAVDPAAFDESLADLLSDPRRLAQRLFAIRADGLLHATAPSVARGRLSGALIGAELAATRPYWLGQDVAIIGARPLAGLYARALGAQGVTAHVLDDDPMTLAGLTHTHAMTLAKE